jgi:hypothetical protein
MTKEWMEECEWCPVVFFVPFEMLFSSFPS